MKITRFRDIPQFIRDGNWECDFTIDDALGCIEKWREEYNLDTNPDFQRLHVWTEEQQIAWIEFILRGGKTGKVLYFNCPQWAGRVGDMVLVDGKQRLEAIRRFVRNEIPVFGSYYREFTDHMGLTYAGVKLNVNTLPTRADVLRWYIQMNRGGTPHTKEEIAKAEALLAAEVLR